MHAGARQMFELRNPTGQPFWKLKKKKKKKKKKKTYAFNSVSPLANLGGSLLLVLEFTLQ